MIRKILIAVALLCLITTNITFAYDRHSTDNPADYSIVLIRNFPHLMPVIFANSETLKITEAQEESLKEIIADVKTPFYAKAEEAMRLEKELSDEILKKGKTEDEVKEKLDALIKTKTEVAVIYFGAMNRIKKILTEEQYDKVLKIAFKDKYKGAKNEKDDTKRD